MFVQGPPRPWSNDEIFKGLKDKVDELFLGDSNKEFKNTVNTKYVELSETKFNTIFDEDLNREREQQKEILGRSYPWF